jgi:hypothetical protein
VEQGLVAFVGEKVAVDLKKKKKNVETKRKRENGKPNGDMKKFIRARVVRRREALPPWLRAKRYTHIYLEELRDREGITHTHTQLKYTYLTIYNDND